VFLVAVLAPEASRAQQFVTDNYLAMPHGTFTVCCSVGERETVILPSISLFPNWEFFAGATLVHADQDRGEDKHYQTDFHVKWQIHENSAGNGGLAMQFGTGSNPGFQSKTVRLDSFRAYHYRLLGTMAFLDGRLSWDLNPGILYTRNIDDPEVEDEWRFTYATRVALYGIVPQSALVGEVYGTVGDNFEGPEYKFGVRWEPTESLNVAVTYGWNYEDVRGPGLELGVLWYLMAF